MLPRAARADSFRCISSCFALRLRSSVASSSLFWKRISIHTAGLAMQGVLLGR